MNVEGFLCRPVWLRGARTNVGTLFWRLVEGNSQILFKVMQHIFKACCLMRVLPLRGLPPLNSGQNNYKNAAEITTSL